MLLKKLFSAYLLSACLGAVYSFLIIPWLGGFKEPIRGQCCLESRNLHSGLNSRATDLFKAITMCSRSQKQCCWLFIYRYATFTSWLCYSLPLSFQFVLKGWNIIFVCVVPYKKFGLMCFPAYDWAMHQAFTCWSSWGHKDPRNPSEAVNLWFCT